MPIDYTLSRGGHFVHAVASGDVTVDDLADYEERHCSDSDTAVPILELLEIQAGALSGLTNDDIAVAFELRKRSGTVSVPHRCAIVVSPDDEEGRILARYYEEMARAHFPEAVVVFADVEAARKWLGVGLAEGTSPAA